MIISLIVCDDCKKVGPVPGEVYGTWRAHRARHELKDLGWSVGRPLGQDLCERCTEQGKRIERLTPVDSRIPFYPTDGKTDADL